MKPLQVHRLSDCEAVFNCKGVSLDPSTLPFLNVLIEGGLQ